MTTRRAVTGTILGLVGLTGAARGADVVVAWEGSVNIPDIIEPPGIFVEIEVEPHGSGENTILDVDLGFRIPHTWQGDLIIALEHVDTGTFVEVLNRPGAPERSPWGFSVDNYGHEETGAHFISDDEADIVYDVPEVEYPGIPDVVGRFRPEAEPLSTFDGERITGRWRFWVGDKGGGDLGTIKGIQLRFRTTTCIGDADRDGLVGLSDLLALLAAWGDCPPECAPDTNDDGMIDLTDLLAVLAAWGACP